MLVPSLTPLNRSSGRTQDRSTQVNGAISNLLSRGAHPIKSLISLSTAKDPETWSQSIIEALLGNLIYDGSSHGQFGTPDNDIIKAICHTHNSRWVWTRILGIKLDLLIINAPGKISDTQLRRIQDIQKTLEKEFTKPTSLS
ncbi:hypothetical protein H7170_03340 [Candidatus Gracilibacteria bacterium]|nr:hypothetical protein [Candidatus Gracilibacteria bacterium]